MIENIILIGPMGAGKSTQGGLLADTLDLPRCPMDSVRWNYYREIGYSDETASEIEKAEGFAGVYRYWKPFEAHAVERLLTQNQDCVIDFGAGHSVYEDEALFARVQAALAPYPNVVLLLPSPDPDASLRILQERSGAPAPDGFDLNAHFVRHPSNATLAKIVIYTQDRTPEQTRDEVLAAVRRQESAAPAAYEGA